MLPFFQETGRVGSAHDAACMVHAHPSCLLEFFSLCKPPADHGRENPPFVVSGASGADPV